MNSFIQNILMKKLSLTLITIVTLSISVYFVSCKKDSEPPPQELPAIQKIRDAANKNWEIADKTLLEIPITFDKKLKGEFLDFATDTSILVTCRVRFKEKDQDVFLPHVEKGLGGNKYYFFSLSGGTPKLFFYNPAISDFNVSGTSSALPVESITIVYEKITLD